MMHVAPPGVVVTLYVTPNVPVTAGQDNVIVLLAMVVAMLVGTGGGPSGLPEAMTAAAEPNELVPTTLTEYVTPLVRPSMVHVLAFTTVQVAPPGVAVATYVMPGPSPGC